MKINNVDIFLPDGQQIGFQWFVNGSIKDLEYTGSEGGGGNLAGDLIALKTNGIRINYEPTDTNGGK
jgi:hypothetical protein